jgi:hypothetical protein
MRPCRRQESALYVSDFLVDRGVPGAAARLWAELTRATYREGHASLCVQFGGAPSVRRELEAAGIVVRERMAIFADRACARRARLRRALVSHGGGRGRLTWKPRFSWQYAAPSACRAPRSLGRGAEPEALCNRFQKGMISYGDLWAAPPAIPRRDPDAFSRNRTMRFRPHLNRPLSRPALALGLGLAALAPAVVAQNCRSRPRPSCGSASAASAT